MEKEKLTFREIHLDFHTGEDIPSVGEAFSEEEFADILKTGHINLINLFAKCHHGMFYYNDTKFAKHPNLKCDLLPKMIKVCEENNVQYAVYISAGLDEASAKAHPEWMCRDANGNTEWTSSHLEAGYRLLCFNSPYMDFLLSQIDEVITKFPRASEYFLDICDERICYCKYCMEDYKKNGIDPHDFASVSKHAHDVYKNYYTRVNDLINRKVPKARIFHNMGNVVRNRLDFLYSNTHVEIESLPTGSWGYDHFPLCCTYARRSGLDYVAHTGKFHTMWGDFGGFKNPNAILYETSLHGAFGAKSLVGDQLHPSGKFDKYTYESIGRAYEQIEKLEPWLDNTDAVADIGVISQDCIERAFNPIGDTSVGRILLQGHYLFDLLDSYSDFSRYKLIILPDTIKLGKDTELLSSKLKEFVNNGGKLLASGESGLENGKFICDLGANFIGKDIYKPTFAKPVIEMPHFNGVCSSMYEDAFNVEATGKVLFDKYEPYFNRTVQHFCSHLYTPYDPNNKTAGVTMGKGGCYIAWNIFTDYGKCGAVWMKEMVCSIIDELIGDTKTIKTNLPTNGVITLLNQPKEKRFVNHVLYVSPFLRGSVQVIEDIVPIYDVEVSFKTDKKITKCYLAPSMEEVPFKQEKDVVSYKINKIWCKKVVVSEYEG